MALYIQRWEVHKDHKILHNILSRLVLKRQYLYSAIEFLIQSHESLASPTHHYSLCNNIKHDIQTSTRKARATYGRFLEPRLREARLIIQKVKKLRGQYLVFTVEKHVVLNFWTILIYNPRTCRKFVASLYFSDMLNMNPSFLEKMCPSELPFTTAGKVAIHDYARFSSYYNDQQQVRIGVQSSVSLRDVTERILETSRMNERTTTQELTTNAELLTMDLDGVKLTKEKSTASNNHSTNFSFMEIKVCMLLSDLSELTLIVLG